MEEQQQQHQQRRRRFFSLEKKMEPAKGTFDVFSLSLSFSLFPLLPSSNYYAPGFHEARSAGHAVAAMYSAL